MYAVKLFGHPVFMYASS